MKSCYKAGLIRVITLPDAEAAGIHGRLIMECVQLVHENG